MAWKETIAPAVPKTLVPISSLLITSDLLDPVADVEAELTVALDGLQQRGVLQALYSLSLKELLNPAVESHVMDATSDEEIYHAVMETQHSNLLTNDDEDRFSSNMLQGS
ncbi:hypothetical protein F5141DRAFT_1211295 [Pisolithus sp. B1]|nr:hypothetical protein F5141DRAFT_1211295 [Pisolithus sp. B1]